MLNTSLILRTFTPCISCCDVLFHSFRTWDCLKTGEIANGGDFGAKSSRVGPETPPVRRTSTDSSTGSCRRPAEIKKERLIIFPMGGLHAYVVCHTGVGVVRGIPVGEMDLCRTLVGTGRILLHVHVDPTPKLNFQGSNYGKLL